MRFGAPTRSHSGIIFSVSCCTWADCTQLRVKVQLILCHFHKVYSSAVHSCKEPKKDQWSVETSCGSSAIATRIQEAGTSSGGGGGLGFGASGGITFGDVVVLCQAHSQLTLSKAKSEAAGGNTLFRVHTIEGSHWRGSSINLTASCQWPKVKNRNTTCFQVSPSPKVNCLCASSLRYHAASEHVALFGFQAFK